MEIRRQSGETTIEPYDEEKLRGHLADVTVERVTIHKPGARVQWSDGRMRCLGDDGIWHLI